MWDGAIDTVIRQVLRDVKRNNSQVMKGTMHTVSPHPSQLSPLPLLLLLSFRSYTDPFGTKSCIPSRFNSSTSRTESYTLSRGQQPSLDDLDPILVFYRKIRPIISNLWCSVDIVETPNIPPNAQNRSLPSISNRKHSNNPPRSNPSM
jgi:hypothetical protein